MKKSEKHTKKDNINQEKYSKQDKDINTKEKYLGTKKKTQVSRIEENINKLLAEISKENTTGQSLIGFEEILVISPRGRVNSTLTPHPFEDELIMFGGQCKINMQIQVFNELYVFNVKTCMWKLIFLSNSPPERCCHQAVAVPYNNGEIWVFGGKYWSSEERRYICHSDLWVYNIDNKYWRKISRLGSPFPRCNHGMVYMKKHLYIFGGFYNSVEESKYLNDLYSFNLFNHTWTRINTIGFLPLPRADFLFVPIPENRILLYGGHSKEYQNKDSEKCNIFNDMFVLSTENTDNGSRMVWAEVNQTGDEPSPRIGATGVLVKPNLLYIYGGVFDIKYMYDYPKGLFFDDIYALDLKKFYWRLVTVDRANKMEQLIPQYKKNKRKKQAKQKNDDNKENEEPNIRLPGPSISTQTDFPVENHIPPSARMNTSLAVKNNVLYLYSGLIREVDYVYTIGDFHSLDLSKLREWDNLIRDSSDSSLDSIE